ncbi:MAG: Aminomethyltransferase (glycine cleavage system T protein) [uncultured Solirubrobacteraceae bacterium]|uniref:Aminomethyltransferase (Glycine cleavage system T protein) n=1 Tax=uncultured Solirubrobacteraceae bacterium TaxID=1162706 RepID=A0A6J4T521_9ACTN|nr:MAG: Aminomethyltransferase (glycine cleavage system T protein) [uncultured Solirubrobacteraceae bacterium]
MRAARAAGPAERLVPFVITGGGIARAGDPVVGGGEVTSGTHSPSLGVGIGMAYLPAGTARVGNRFEIDVRGRIRTAEVRTKPLYVRPEQPLA